VEISAEGFRRRLAGLENPEIKKDDADKQEMREIAISLVLALREVYGSSLERKALWQRIANGLNVAKSKSGGFADRFIVEALDFVRADPNLVVGNARLIDIYKRIKGQPKDWQMLFIRECVVYRNLLLLEARARITSDKELAAQLGAEEAAILSGGEIVAKGVAANA
jgi:hypothetical protein